MTRHVDGVGQEVATPEYANLATLLPELHARYGPRDQCTPSDLKETPE